MVAPVAEHRGGDFAGSVVAVQHDRIRQVMVATQSGHVGFRKETMTQINYQSGRILLNRIFMPAQLELFSTFGSTLNVSCNVASSDPPLNMEATRQLVKPSFRLKTRDNIFAFFVFSKSIKDLDESGGGAVSKMSAHLELSSST